eukprot:CAMPEP_0204265964 /NCGR_PEP_ID=MMETSP0468-20130131/10020_1 /ASSEMBLY_ACC=CAM_ASM_000383 /TAXON_ID=2969 /ORGANISM="Oxyrrhis marina" /LENGTH=33 /DNA_ID= /DNA_START= /DNA_END= /DNA_ORIENTATION=
MSAQLNAKIRRRCDAAAAGSWAAASPELRAAPA